MTALDILIEKERRMTIALFILKSREILSEIEWSVLKLYCIDKMSFELIGREIKKSERTARRIFEGLPQKLQDNIPKKLYEECRLSILPLPSEKEAGTPKVHIGWLVERLQKVNAGLVKREVYENDNKVERYVGVTECRIPEYLEQSFKNQPMPVCTLCGNKCKRV